MNKLVIPPSPNWYETSIMCCAVDNTLVYGSRTDIIVLKPGIENKPVDTKIISRAHSQKILSVNLSRKWTDSCKLGVTVSEDKVIKVWDFEKMERKAIQDGHVINTDRVIGAAFAGDERVISVSESGYINIWQINSNESSVIKDLFGHKVSVTCLSVCPHAPWIVAFGLKSGLVYVTDVRRKGKILYRLRGHEKSVLCLSWCPVPINVFPKKPRNIIKPISSDTSVLVKSEENTPSTSTDCLESIDSNITNNDPKPNIKDDTNETQILTEEIDLNTANNNLKLHIEDDTNIIETQIVIEEEKKPQRKNPWANLKHADDNEIPADYAYSDRELPKPLDLGDSDFLTECSILKKKILGSDDEKLETVNESLNEPEPVKLPQRKILKIKKKFLEKFSKTGTENKEGIEEKLSADKEESPSTLKQVNKGIEEKHSEVKEEFLSTLTQVDEAESVPEKTDTEDDTETSEQNTSGNLNTQFDENESVEVASSSVATVETHLTNAKELAENSVIKSIEVIESSDSAPVIIETDLTNTQEIAESSVKSIEATESSVSAPNNLELAGGGDTVCDKGSENVLEKIVDEKGDAVKEYSLHPVNVYLPPPEEEPPRKEFLLASSGKDSNIYIWRAGTDGRMQTFLSVSGKSHKGKSRVYEKIFITICWISPNILLSSSRTGELVEWTIPRPLDTKCPQPKLIHKDHQGSLFCISGPVTISTAENFHIEEKKNVWTTGIDRLLLNTSLDSQRTNLANYRTFGGAVHCFASSPFDPSRLALGVSEGCILLWDLSRPHLNHINMTRYYQYIKSKVTALIWNPSKEFELIYSTYEGRIALLDTSKINKEPTILPAVFRSPVHNLEFGPLNGKINDLGLYTIAEGRVMLYDVKHPKKDPIFLPMPKESMYAYYFSWKPDYSYLIVSVKTGELNIYSTDLVFIKTLYFSQKGMVHIVWHPDAASSDLSCSNWLACTVNGENTFTVYDFSVLLSSDNLEDPKRIVGTFEGHVDFVNKLAWSPYDGNKIVSAGEDGVAHVWDVTTKQIISTYVEPNFESIFSSIWSPVNENFIISSARTNSVTVWNINENPPKNDKAFMSKRSKHISTLKTESQSLVPKPEKPNKTQEKVKKTSVFDGNSLFADKGLSKQLCDMRKLLAVKENKNNDTKDSDGTVDKLNDETSALLNLFGTKEDMLKLMAKSANGHLERKNHNMCTIISLFSGENIGDNIKSAIAEKRVTPQILSIATMISPTLWREACETYANQLALLNTGDPTEAATYFLACHKVEEAISVLCSNNMFKEALVIAKCRLAPEDPTVNKIIDNWAKDATQKGLFEIAAQCYIVLGSYEDAAKVLFRRSDESLKFAVELAELTGNQELLDAILFRYKSFCKPIESSETETPLPSKAQAALNCQAQSSSVKDDGVCSSSETLISEIDVISNNNDINQSDICDSTCGDTVLQSKASKVKMNAEAPEFIPPSLESIIKETNTAQIE